MKIGILGCGSIAQSMANTLIGMNQRGDDVELYAVASRSLDKAEAFAAKNHFAKAYGSYEEMVSDDELELVYVATPHSHHFEHMKLCIDHGKHVLCEKAFTANAKQAKEITEYAKSKNILVTEAQWVRYMPLVKKLRDVIASGVIGDITTVTSNLHYSIDMNERIYTPELAGGALLDVGIYTINFTSICLGNDYSDMIASCVKFETGVDRQSSISIIYPDGKMAICNSGTQAISDRKGIIYGRNGHIIVENINNPESITVFNSDRQIVARYDAPEQITGYEYEVLAAIDAVTNNLTECPDCPHSETIAMMEMMDKAREQMGIRFPFE